MTDKEIKARFEKIENEVKELSTSIIFLSKCLAEVSENLNNFIKAQTEFIEKETERIIKDEFIKRS